MPLLSTLHGNTTAQELSGFFARNWEKIQDLALPEFIQEIVSHILSNAFYWRSQAKKKGFF